MEPARAAGAAADSRWWLTLVRGLLAVFFGFWMVAKPDWGPAVLAAFLGCYAAVDGAAALLLGAPGRTWLVAAGILTLLMGAAAFARPLLGDGALVYVLACWALLLGPALVADAFAGPGDGSGARRAWPAAWPTGWPSALTGAGALMLGMLLLAGADRGLPAALALTGAYAMAAGIVHVFHGFGLYGRREGGAGGLSAA